VFFRLRPDASALPRGHLRVAAQAYASVGRVPVKVAFVCGGLRPRYCGVSDYVVRLIGVLPQQVEPVVLAAAPAEAPFEVLTPCADWRLRDVLAVVRTVRRLDPDLVHVQYAPVSFRWRRAAHLLPLLVRRPVVVTAHEVDALPFHRALVAHATATIATTPQHAARLGAARRLRLVPIGPNIQPPPDDAGQLAREARAGWSIPLTAPLVVFFGFLHPVKGLEYLVRGFTRVRQRYPEARLVLAGGWESLALPGEEGRAYRDRLQALRTEVGLDGAVLLTGYLRDREVSGLLFAADVVALPFTYGLSFKSGSLLAALAHGAPVVGTSSPDDHDDASDYMLKVPPRDAGALAEALLDLLDDPAQRLRLAQAGRRAAEPFAWSAIADAHLAIYDTVLAGKRDLRRWAGSPASKRNIKRVSS
jgi:glycosyltransferase involved in cell wall biosynthesis